MFRAFATVMAALLGGAAALNFNDPDLVRWVAIYGAACVVSILVAARGGVPVAIAASVGAVALAWAILWALRVRDIDAYAHMFDEWKMTSATAEEARETCGLIIVAVWMLAIVIRAVVGAG